MVSYITVGLDCQGYSCFFCFKFFNLRQFVFGFRFFGERVFLFGDAFYFFRYEGQIAQGFYSNVDVYDFFQIFSLLDIKGYYRGSIVLDLQDIVRFIVYGYYQFIIIGYKVGYFCRDEINRVC